jgi:hypothetical protein
MSANAKLICGILLLTIPGIQYGGFFLLKILSGKESFDFTPFQKAMFRAGHAHAGVLLILSVIAQVLIDQLDVLSAYEWILRIAFPGAVILISGGFFASAIGKTPVKPNRFIWILYCGITILAIAVMSLGIALVAD